MSYKLNFYAHVPIIGIAKRLSIIIPKDALVTLYKMFIGRHLDYADIIYNKPPSHYRGQGRSPEKLYQ